MFRNSKYNKLLTIILIVIIIGIAALIVYLGIDFYIKSKQTSESEEILGKFDEYINNETIGTLPSENNVIDVPVNEVVQNNTNNTTTNTTLMYEGYAVEGKIEIPKTNLKCPILEGNGDTIEIAVGRLYGPGLNKVGNNTIIGHNYRNGTFFSDNKKLTEGDKIYITDLSGKRVEYEIYKKYITTPEDYSYNNRDTQGRREISLSTCTDDVTGRLIIWAKEK